MIGNTDDPFFEPSQSFQGKESLRDFPQEPAAKPRLESRSDRLPSSNHWIHQLVQAEVGGYDPSLVRTSAVDPHELMDQSAASFLGEVRDRLSEYLRAFNQYAEQGKRFPEVKLYQVAQTATDFMLYRNQVKLVFSLIAHGVIRISIESHRTSQALSVDGLVSPQWVNSSQSPVHSRNGGFSGPQEILAQMGPFREIYWMFQGEKILPEQLAKFYFQEFVRLSHQPSRLTPGNQQLLNQLRALLRESAAKESGF
jgi:hypothetical protein